MIKFEENNIIKKKIYLFDCIVHGCNYCLIVVITYDKCIFSTKNNI